MIPAVFGKPYRSSSGLLIRPGASFSASGLHRYALTREWVFPGDLTRWVCFIGLNPSTADAFEDDPTIRRELGFAQALGANALVKVNLASYRATDPKELLRFARAFGVEAARGPENDEHIRQAVAWSRSALGKGVFAAWGAVPSTFEPDEAFLARLGKPLMCLGTTKSGAPRHPLYLSKAAMPMEWRA